MSPDSNSGRAEWALDIAASALLMAAVGFAVRTLVADTDLAISSATIAFILALASLRNIVPGDAVDDAASHPGREIPRLLSVSRDAAASACGDQRVLRRGAPDASQALSDAFAKLRRSLR
jgi:hypothetical protein